ncbi:Zinc finger C2H2-type,Zinc finger, RING/FYVE/PHD-type [Cinara cedri]|uniref:Zinc finger C2H2-type,Zinc finger, RING/FYVE/PHD-type n=1 Tax=Cinara cedri TaxID=506608 RepID=A0A5E4NQX0_9HEMI|nr:Zinc finger C2H2-type,Zinc finger, RING/FYVE/PHD-type [Cinara cedri]
MPPSRQRSTAPGPPRRTEPHMMRHVKPHEGVKFACNLCNKLFIRKDTLAYHMKEVHPQGRTISCFNKDIQVNSYGNDQKEIALGINVDNIQAGASTNSNLHTWVLSLAI